MKFNGISHFDHAGRQKLGVLVTNLGTPAAPDKKAVRAFLREFLSDPRVVELPRLLWLPVLHGIILNTRPAKSAAAYRKIWTEDGSPLKVHTENQAAALQQLLTDRYAGEVIVEHAMRYGEPSIGSAVQRLLDQGADRLIVLPLYPQYSCTTTGSTFDALAADLRTRRWIPDLKFVDSYHDHPHYIAALADSIRRHRASHGNADKLVFSYHGEPKRNLDEGDPYFCQCLKTTRLVAQALNLSENDYVSAFQSRFGAAEWLRPYTDETLQKLAGSGTQSVQVVCPGFSADCLETLEEIALENRETFIQAGGMEYQYIPCLNSGSQHIAALADIIAPFIEAGVGTDDSVGRLERAQRFGAEK